MKINNNISAVISNKHLLRNENSLSISMEKLSSGYKINHSGDDPSGMAISSKMRAQIRGLDQASQNASDGMSVLETADGALNEVTDMIQRMRELSVQAANGTNSESDRASIQMEVDDLREEIDRVSETTEFNTKKLLDGSLDKRVYTDGISRVAISDDVPAGKYGFTITSMPTKAELTTTSGANWSTLASRLDAAMEAADTDEAFININGSGATLKKGMTSEDIYTIIRKTAELGEAELSNYNEEMSLRSIGYGDEASLEIQMDTCLAEALGVTLEERTDPDGDPILIDPDDPSAIGQTTKAYAKITAGKNADITLDKGSTSDFGNQATYTTMTKESSGSASRSVDGRRIKMTDVGGFEIDFLIDEKTINKATGSEKFEIEISDIGPMNLQIGANEGQQMSVRIDSMSSMKMYLDQVDVSTERGATRALEQLDEALAMISNTRSGIGAYTNRLEHAVKSLDATSENMNQAISRIQDADIAKEMTEYTKYNVLQKAATSALSQANELPQTALQLLQ